jgi:sulfite reductase (NADPH) flavoprotein alpha-component
VLALGGSSYPRFCETGRQVHDRLAQLGAKRLLPFVGAMSTERLATPWLEQVVTGARETLGAPASTVTRLRAVAIEP